MNFPLVLAADFGGIIFLLFALVSFISWLINQAKGAQQAPPPRRPNQPGPQRNPQVQREIERFLREAGGQQRPQKPVVEVDDIEIVETPRSRRPPAKRKLVEKPRPSQRPSLQGAKPAADRPGQRLADRHLAPAAQSAVASEHLPQRVAAEQLPHDVARSVSEQLGVFAAGSATGVSSRKQKGSSAAFLTELRSPRGIRAAIIMQEILQRPRALRRRTS
jgi:hypothetical protein